MANKKIQMKDGSNNNLYPNVVSENIPSSIGHGISVTGNLTASGKITASGDVQGSNVIATSAIYEGGTASSNKLSAKYMPFPTQYSHSASWTAWQTGVEKSWTVSGSGVVFLSASVYTDATQDTGNTMAILYYDGNVVAHDENRFTASSSARAAANSAIMLKVTNGKVIKGFLQSTKAGSKAGMWYALAFGCTLT